MPIDSLLLSQSVRLKAPTIWHVIVAAAQTCRGVCFEKCSCYPRVHLCPLWWLLPIHFEPYFLRCSKISTTLPPQASCTGICNLLSLIDWQVVLSVTGRLNNTFAPFNGP